MVLESILVFEVKLLEVLQTLIFYGRQSGLRWSDFGQLGSGGRFLTWFQATALTNLAIDIFTLLT